MNKTTIYIPIVNLNVESQIQIGKVLVHPSGDVSTIGQVFPQDPSAARDIQENLGKSAFVEIKVERIDEKLIPKDTSDLENMIRESMSILYLMQKQIAGIHSVKNQIFGLRSDTPSFLNFIAAAEGTKTSYGFRRGGNFAEWTFTTKSLQEVQVRDDFQLLSRVAASDNRTDMEQRIMKAVSLIYEGALELKPQHRFTRIMTGFEVLFLIKGEQGGKAFTLAKICTMMSHTFLHPQSKCLCPILEASKADDYSERVKNSGLPGICSAYNEFKKWYATRSDITHEDNLKTVNDHISSFEWWAHQYFMKAIEIVARNGYKNLPEFLAFIKQEYTIWRSSFDTKSS
jgi:hypothetical protein